MPHLVAPMAQAGHRCNSQAHSTRLFLKVTNASAEVKQDDEKMIGRISWIYFISKTAAHSSVEVTFELRPE